LDLVVILDLSRSQLIALVLHTFLRRLFHAYGLIILRLESLILGIQVIVIPLDDVIGAQLKARGLLLLTRIYQISFSVLVQEVGMASRIAFFESYCQWLILLIVVHRVATVELFKLLYFFTLAFEYSLHFLLSACWAFVADSLIFGC
jgi:hypothetical protein